MDGATMLGRRTLSLPSILKKGEPVDLVTDLARQLQEGEDTYAYVRRPIQCLVEANTGLEPDTGIFVRLCMAAALAMVLHAVIEGIIIFAIALAPLGWSVFVDPAGTTNVRIFAV
jgi:zinc transporter ZupT